VDAGSKRFAGRSWALYFIQQESLRLPGSSRGPQTSYLTSDGVWFKPHCSFRALQREAFFSDSGVKDEGRWAVSVLSALGRSKTWMSERERALTVSKSMRDWDVSGFHCSRTRSFQEHQTRDRVYVGTFAETQMRLQIRSLGPLYIEAKHSNYIKTKRDLNIFPVPNSSVSGQIIV